ncbi:hypothetical protein [Pontibacter roseus]|uniref:hypothetical protein n=1 Tax=Pontibacter roseus TaxID=336989 RepID=UPI0003A14F87|nr:hypothetical protein [Pontibacter roseus]
MRRHLYLLPLYLVLLLSLSCQPDQGKTVQTDAATEASETKADATHQEAPQVDEALVKECTEYWAEIQRLNSISADYYAKEFLPNALANPALTEQNREFLIALGASLNQTSKEHLSTLAVERVLLPMFKLKEDELGIFGFPAYDAAKPDIRDSSLEYKILVERGLIAPHDEPQTNLALYPTLADSLLKNRNQSVYAYTATGKVKTRITNFGSYQGECLQYYNYLVDSKPFSNKDKVLFASRYNLDLIYKDEPEMDALLKSQYKKQCQDCPNSGELEKTFASLKGVEGLYFTYADTFPLNNELETPLRGLVMKLEDRFVYLWYDEVDLVGCSCI